MVRLWGDEATELRRRHWVVLRIILRNLAANAIGIVFVTIYDALSRNYSVAEAGAYALKSITSIEALVVIGMTALAVVLIGHPLRRWYLSFPPLPTKPDERVQRIAMLPPLLMTIVSMADWLIWSFIIGLERSGGHLFSETMLQSLLSYGVAGVIAGLLSYFTTETIWAHELPLFFPEGHIRKGVFRFTVRTRVLLLFVMGMTALLYLAIAIYIWAARYLFSAVDPFWALKRLRQLEFLIVSASALTAFLLAATVGQSLVEGLKQIREAMERVSKGDLDVKVHVYTNDEIGDLAEGFNHMVEGLRAQQLTRCLLDSYVSPEVANYALQHGTERGGVLTEATVLFSDIRDFTALAEKLPPSKVMNLLNRYFQAMEEAVRAYGGIINKFVGDSLMAIFGTPINPLVDHAEAAIWAAAEMMRTLRIFNETQKARGEPTLNIGIGIATGQVVAGNVGGLERIEYTLIGNTVNVASRLEAMTKEMKVPILLAEETAQASEGMFPVRYLGEVKVRGKEESVTVYTVEMTS